MFVQWFEFSDRKDQLQTRSFATLRCRCLKIGADQGSTSEHVAEPPTTSSRCLSESVSVVFDHNTSAALVTAENDADHTGLCVADGVVDGFLNNAIEGHHRIWRKAIENCHVLLVEAVVQRGRRVADTALQQRLDGLPESEELQHGRLCLVDDYAQFADAVLDLLCEGLSAPQMGKRLYLGTTTVKTHLGTLYEKLGVSDRAAAVAEAMRRGLVR